MMTNKGSSSDLFAATCSGTAKDIAATMEGAYAERVEGLLARIVDEEGQPRLPIVKTALQAGWNNYQLHQISEKIEEQLTAAKNDGNLKALWMIAEAYRLETAEGVVSHPDAINKMNEALLVSESLKVEQEVRVELLMRSGQTAVDIVSKLQASPEMTPAELLAWAKERAATETPSLLPGTDSSGLAEYTYQLSLRRRLEKAKDRGDAQAMAKYAARLEQ